MLTTLMLLACRHAPTPVVPEPRPPVVALPLAKPADVAAAVAETPVDLLAVVDEPTAYAALFGLGVRGRSHSIGTAQNGYLQGGLAVRESSALKILPQTRARGFFWGTAELVQLLEKSAQAVAEAYPGSTLHLGNLSKEGGGDIAPSHSHNSGRDADVLFFAFDRNGSDAAPANFVHFDDNGLSDAPDPGRWEFDTPRNWALVRRWLTDPDVVVQWIFVAVPLRNRLLDYALREREPQSLRDRAMHVLVQPRDSSPHADHFHIRIACPGDDRPACIDGFGQTAHAREAQVDALLQMYAHGSPEEQRYARELLTLPVDGSVAELPPIEGDEGKPE